MNRQFPSALETAIADNTTPFDPRSVADEDRLRELVAALLHDAPTIESLAALERDLIEHDPTPLIAQLAVKLARSKLALRSIKAPVHTSVVFAMYREHTRILPIGSHPHAEDFLVRKIDQLRWLFEDIPDATWQLIAADDGCPENSGHLAQRVLAERCPDAPARVLFLENAIAAGIPITHPMASTSDSQKGGAVCYAMWDAIQQTHENHAVVYTDADLSTHLGQVGLLVDGIINMRHDAAIGSRREPTSVVIKSGKRNTRGKLFIYLWKGLVRALPDIIDTQCGFKAFNAAALPEILDNLIEKRFAFDIELLIKTQRRRPGSILRVPIAWIDSEAASTTTDLEPYLPMLRSVVSMYHAYMDTTPECDQIASFIESLTEDSWAYLAEHVPVQIADGDPAHIAIERPVQIEELRSAVSSAH